MRNLFLLCVGSSAVLLGFAPVTAHGSHNEMTNCTQFCDTSCSENDSNCVPANSEGFCQIVSTGLTCAAGEGPIELRNGTNLDLHGATVECTASGSSSCNGIVMTSSGSRVFNGHPTLEATIEGRFDVAVDCGGFARTWVDGITIDGAAVAVQDCAKVVNNVLKGLDLTIFGINVGVSTTTTRGTDRIENNYIRDKIIAIRVDGASKMKISNNVIHTGSTTRAIEGDDQTDFVVDGNVFLGEGLPFPSSPPESPTLFFFRDASPAEAEYKENVCDQDHPDCDSGTSSCVGSGRCIPFTSPF